MRVGVRRRPLLLKLLLLLLLTAARKHGTRLATGLHRADHRVVGAPRTRLRRPNARRRGPGHVSRRRAAGHVGGRAAWSTRVLLLLRRVDRRVVGSSVTAVHLLLASRTHLHTTNERSK